MPTEQIAVRVPVDLLDALDDMVQRGRYVSRAAAVRAGLIALAEADRRHRIDENIVEGYTRVPPTPLEDAGARASLRDAIIEEPW